MTVQEAIKKHITECEERIFRIKDYLESSKDAHIDECKENILVLVTAIQALKEVEQYRALGTPTQILERIGGLDVELGKYHCLGTVEELKEAREKQIASKWIECPYADLIMCPSCNAEFSTIDNCTEQFEYCPKCGKRLE